MDGSLTKGLAFQTESFDSVINEILPLLQKHWQEIARNRETIVLDPDYAKYKNLENAGVLRIFTAREAGLLVGYAIYFIHTHLHYKNNTWAISDIFWVDPSARRGRTGLRFFQFIEGQLTDLGADVMHTTSKVAHPAAARLLEHLGHSMIECGHAKLLRKGKDNG